MSAHDLHPDTIVQLSWKLLNEWWCVPVSADEETALRKIAKTFQIGLIVKDLVVKGDLSLIRDRLYGGFRCEDPARRHVCFITGQYTYVWENVPLTAEQRREMWEQLFAEQMPPDGFIGGGFFTEDAPALRDLSGMSPTEIDAAVDMLLNTTPPL